MSASVVFNPRDRARLPASVTSGNFHIDLTQAPNSSWLYRAYRSGSDARVERSIDAGVTWETPLSIAGGFETGTNATIPTVVVDRWDNVLVAAHLVSENAEIWIQEKPGDAFALLSTIPGVRYPRLASGSMLWCAVHDNFGEFFFYSTDGGVTWTDAASLVLAIAFQLVAFRIDRNDLLHVIYQDGGGALQHVWTEDMTGWSTPVQIAAAGAYPGYALNDPAGAVLYWDGATLKSQLLECDYQTPSSLLTAPAGAWKKGFLGAWGTLREDWMICGKIATDLETRYSPDLGVNWPTPA